MPIVSSLLSWEIENVDRFLHWPKASVETFLTCLGKVKVVKAVPIKQALPISSSKLLPLKMTERNFVQS